MTRAGPGKFADRLFFALFPPSEVQDEIVGVGNELGLGRPMRAERLHLNLLLLPDHVDGLPHAVVAAAQRAGGAVSAAPFHFALGKVGGLSNAVLLPGRGEPLAALSAFQQQLARATEAQGLSPHPRFRFNPHVTLGHGAREPVSRAVHPVVSWRATDFVLIHSYAGLGRYDLVDRWPLEDGE